MAKRINNVTIKEVTLQASDEKKTCEMVIFRADPNVLDPSARLDFVID